VATWWGAAAQEGAVQAKLGIGDTHGVWLKADGSVWTWGGNSRGQLGIDGDHAFAPMPVPELSGIRDVAAGDRLTAAVRNDGRLWTWGENEYGELGNGTTKDSPKPTQVAGLTGVMAVAARAQHILALRSDGTVWAWGDDPASSASPQPHKVAGLSGVLAIATSQRHHVALKSDGTVWIWGNHGAGDLGNGTYGVSPAPLQVPGLAGIQSGGCRLSTHFGPEDGRHGVGLGLWSRGATRQRVEREFH
jgi:alpha-tubulin suppressor-like RCC1 family protein